MNYDDFAVLEKVYNYFKKDGLMHSVKSVATSQKIDLKEAENIVRKLVLLNCLQKDDFYKAPVLYFATGRR